MSCSSTPVHCCNRIVAHPSYIINSSSGCHYKLLSQNHRPKLRDVSVPLFIMRGYVGVGIIDARGYEASRLLRFACFLAGLEYDEASMDMLQARTDYCHAASS